MRNRFYYENLTNWKTFETRSVLKYFIEINLKVKDGVYGCNSAASG